MPTENEFKYVLCPLTDEDIFRNEADRVIEIEQAYLVKQGNTTVRVRRKKEDGKKLYELCFKEKTERVIEIETKIDKRDYKELLDISTNRLVKTRYVCDGWEVDFFKRRDNGEVYFVMAEIECEEDVKQAPEPSELIADKMIYSGVSGTDSRFSSRKLSCPSHAKKVLRDIENVKKYLTEASR